MSYFEENELDKKVMAHVSSGDKECPIQLTNQYVPLAFNNINDVEWRVKNRSPLAGWIYIASKAVRAPGDHDEYDLYHRYFDDNKLASAVSVRQMAKAFRYKQTKKPRDWVRELEAEGAFIIEKIKVPGKPEPANIYILGEYKPEYFVWYYGNLKIPRKDCK